MTSYFNKVLFVGPQYQGQRGGMSSVMEVYSKTIEDFNFVSTYHNRNAIYNIFYFLNALRKIAGKLISNRNIKIVHVHSASRGSFTRKSIVILLAKLFGKKTVLHIHGGEFRLFYKNSGKLRFLISWILNKTDELVCLSDEWKAYFDSITSAKKTRVLNNPVILPHHVEVKPPSHPIRILFLNHITEKKGLFDLTDFFHQNRSWLQGSFNLIIAGAGDDERLIKFIEQNDLGSLIEFKGWISGKDKDDLIQSCDVFILPSYNEGLPMSILESMAFGKAVIATRVGGIPRIVKPGENGWLMEPANLNEMATIFKEIKSQNGIIERYGSNSLLIVQDYSPARVKEKMNEIYNCLLHPNTLLTQQYEYEKGK